MADLEITGLDELERAIKEAPETALPLVLDALGKSLDAILGRVKPYPPQPPRDRGKTFNTYVRGQGHYPREAFGADNLLKKKRAGGRAGSVRYTSERLGTKWTRTIETTDDGLVGVIGNTASYAGEVQGAQQKPYHALTGWKTLGDALTETLPEIDDFFEEAVNKAIAALVK